MRAEGVVMPSYFGSPDRGLTTFAAQRGQFVDILTRNGSDRRSDRTRKSLRSNNARGGIRTHTGLPPRDFKEISPSVRDYTKHHNSALHKRISALPFPRVMRSCAELWSLVGRKLGAAVSSSVAWWWLVGTRVSGGSEPRAVWLSLQDRKCLARYWPLDAFAQANRGLYYRTIFFRPSRVESKPGAGAS